MFQNALENVSKSIKTGDPKFLESASREIQDDMRNLPLARAQNITQNLNHMLEENNVLPHLSLLYGQQHKNEIDTDHNGKISKDEMTAFGKSKQYAGPLESMMAQKLVEDFDKTKLNDAWTIFAKNVTDGDLKKGLENTFDASSAGIDAIQARVKPVSHETPAAVQRHETPAAVQRPDGTYDFPGVRAMLRSVHTPDGVAHDSSRAPRYESSQKPEITSALESHINRMQTGFTNLPSETSRGRHSLYSIAEDCLSARAKFTGEKIDRDAIYKELNRIMKNSGLGDAHLDGKTHITDKNLLRSWNDIPSSHKLVLYTPEEREQFSAKIRQRFVPNKPAALQRTSLWVKEGSEDTTTIVS
jgi:hypothetical protein